MKLTKLIIISLLSAIPIAAYSVDAGLDQFNALKNQVQNNKPARATNASGTSSVGTGEHWESNIQNQLDQYTPGIDAQIDELKQEIEATNSNVYTTSQSVSSLQSITNTQINTLNAELTAMQTRINELESASTGSGASSWETVYEGTGTNSVDVGDYINIKLTGSYTVVFEGSFQGAQTINKTFDNAFVVTDLAAFCESKGVSQSSVVSKACIKFNLGFGTISTPTYKYDKRSYTSMYDKTTWASVTLKNFKLTKVMVTR